MTSSDPIATDDARGAVVVVEGVGPEGLDLVLRGDVVTPRASFDAALELDRALGAATDAMDQHPDLPVHLVVDLPPGERSPLFEALAAGLGLEPSRHLVQMRCPLPIPADHPSRAFGPAVALRPFEPGRDEASWVRQNNRAFATHPSQGSQTSTTLGRTLAEPWVDLDGFLVADDPDRAGELAGSCWTRVHPADGTDAELGEIFVIGVDPDQRIRGLGTTLVLAGLDHLAAGGTRTAMLYVEGDNDRARALYDRLGFTAHVERWIQA